MALLVAGQVGVVVRDVVVCGKEKAAGAAGRVANRLAGLGGNAVHHRLDQRTRREVLAGAGLGVLRVLLQQALVGLALHVGAHRGPVFLVDKVDDHTPQRGRVLELVLRLAEDERARAFLVAEPLERVAVVVEELVAVAGEERGPAVLPGDNARLVVRRLGSLIRHLEEQQVGELLDIIAIAHAVVA